MGFCNFMCNPTPRADEIGRFENRTGISHKKTRAAALWRETNTEMIRVLFISSLADSQDCFKGRLSF
jgi:hypothetical protein